MRQYVEAKFRVEDNRTYAYHNDGEPVAAGDQIRVPDKSGQGWKRVFVVSVGTVAPKFATKAIIGKHVEEPKTGELL